MNTLLITPNDFSPKVILDPMNNIFEISGKSIIENTNKFYNPILQWLEEYKNILYLGKDKLDKAAFCVFRFNLDYINSTSVKAIKDVLIQLDKIAQDGNKILAKWYYDKYDEDMKELGKTFSTLMKKLQFEFSEN